MSKELNVSRAKDREEMAACIERVVTRSAATVTRDPDMTRDRVIWLDIVAPHGLALTIDLDGDDRQQREGCFVLAWHIDTQHDTRLTPLFGRVAGGSVNSFHWAKCTAVQYGFEAMVESLAGALALAADGRAFQPTYQPSNLEDMREKLREEIANTGDT